MASDEYVCPFFDPSSLLRHKTLGVFVPLWRPGPCWNPECQAYEAKEAASEPVPVDGRRTGGRQGQAAELLTLFPRA